MSARRTKAASPWASSAWWRSIAEATDARQVPAAGEHAADQRVVDAELAALVVQALLGRARRAVDLLRVARVGVHEHELADVVQQRGDEQAVAVRVAGRRRRGGRRRAGRRRRAGGSAPGAASHVLPRSKNSKVSALAARRWTASGESTSTAATMRLDLAAARARRGRWRAAGRRSRARRRTRSPGRRRRSTGAPRRPGRAGGCATRPARGSSSSASKAAVRRLPWPSLRGRPTSA